MMMHRIERGGERSLCASTSSAGTWMFGAGFDRDEDEDEGRRRLQEDNSPPPPPACDGDFEQGYTWETLADLLTELTCDDEQPEDLDADLDNPDRQRNPCIELEANNCIEEDSCDLQQDVCVWNQAPENRRNLYVVYDWQYLVEDGEKTEEEWCFSDGLVLGSQEDYNEMCAFQETEEDCLANGCKKFKQNKGKCQPEKKKVNCKELGPEGADKDSAEMKAVCDMYLTIGCSWVENKGCKGKVNFKK